MCTVTYLPLSRKGFVLTSTRDEKNIRQTALPPQQYEISGRMVYFPRDPDAGGTWIAAAEDGYSLCLLNGGFKPHESKPPYRLSRGLLVLDFFKFNDLSKFLEKYDFKGIEPFTLLVKESTQTGLDEIRWDGKHIHHWSMDPGTPAIWSSVTLYPEKVIRMREEWFRKWLASKPVFSIAGAVGFHKNAGTGDMENDIMMNRKKVHTVSITSVFRGQDKNEMFYEDIINSKSYRHNISGQGVF